MPGKKKRRTGETDTSVITIDRETGEIITAKKVNGGTKLIRIEDEKGVEVMPAYSSGCGIDIHSSFGQLTVMVRNQGRVMEFRTAFNTDEFYTGNLNNVHGLGTKAYTLIRDFIGNQKRYQKLYTEKENAKKTAK